MAYIYLKNKKSGVTYVYENHAYWDKEKQQSRAHRKLIGKLDPETQEIIPTRSYQRKNKATAREVLPGPLPILTTKRCFYGVTYLLDQIGRETGLIDDLKRVFPDFYRQILSIAYFLVQSENGTLSRFPHWAQLHEHPFGEIISSQKSSELFQAITEEQRMHFFQLQAKRRSENEYWAFDTTSISSYSETLTQVKRGRNKEHDRLPQINLAFLFGEKSRIPFYYRKLPGNITDVSILNQLLEEMDGLNVKKVKVLMDRGFYSQSNVRQCFEHHQKFLMGAKTSLTYVQQTLEEKKEELHAYGSYLPSFGVHGCVKPMQWKYSVKHPRTGKTEEKTRRVYLSLFYSPEKAAQDQIHWDHHLNELSQDLFQAKERLYWKKEYERYFEVKDTPKRGRQVHPKEAAIQKKQQYFGYFALLSNEVREAEPALELYRSRDIVEKGFNNLKDRLNMRRLQVSSELSLNGKLFVEFIALIYLSWISQAMQKAKLYEQWTLPDLLDELELIEVLEAPEQGRILGEVTEKQRRLFEALGVKPPSL